MFAVRPAILAAFAALLVVRAAAAGPLEDYRGVNRLIVVSLPPGPAAERVAAALVAQRKKISERDLKIIDVSEGVHRVPAAVRLPPEPASAVRKQLKLAAGDARPVFILLGKDGGEKDRQLDTLDLERWFALIDAMPMRQQEMQDPREQTP